MLAKAKVQPPIQQRSVVRPLAFPETNPATAQGQMILLVSETIFGLQPANLQYLEQYLKQYLGQYLGQYSDSIWTVFGQYL